MNYKPNTNDAEAATERNEGNDTDLEEQIEPCLERPKRRSVWLRKINRREAAERQSKRLEARRNGQETYDEEYVIDRIVGHGINDDKDHPTAKVGEKLFHVRRFGYTNKDDTYEPVRHLPRNKIVSYCKKKKIPLPENINDAQLG